MERRFSRSAESTMDSFIMGLVEVAAQPGMISFATGLPDNSLFDTQAMVRAMEEVMSDDPCGALQYDTPTGYIPLRKRIAERCGRVLGFKVGYEDVLMTSGSQVCFDLIGKMFLDHGDVMAVENPGYLGAIQSYSAYSPDFRGVDIDGNGPDIGQLSSAVADGARLFYSIPNHQNPSGVSYPDDARRAVAEVIGGSGCILVEDDAYGELGYNGRVGRTMKSMIPDDTILTGSFSKTISPGMRVGWMVVPEWMRAKAGRSLEACCLQSNTFCQRVIDRFMADMDYDTYLDGLRKGYARKKKVFMDAMEDNLPDTVSWNDPEGGMFVWLRTPEGTDAMRLYERALEGRLVVMPGHPFHVRGGANTIRLNFATPSDEQIADGMKVLGGACRDLYS